MFTNNSRSSSSLDPIPLKLLNDIAPYIISNIAHIIHESLISDTVPLIFKHSLITPIIKKPSLDPPSFNNYRPISNLSILSKTLERVVSKQLSSFLTTNNILCTFQSAYVPNKSTETAITRVTTNILCDLNNTYGTIFVLLDLSAAFDTIDHSLLISRLANIGITGIALKWFTSYISDRISSILINGHISSPRNISYGVPQGSVLGPILFNIYLLPIFDIISKFPLISVHSYVDDI